ncbi:odorant receptor 13a-like [Vespa velutina]|uniref:odorant receptor 13a-like n=1 Tax=Vespa velutina TaxID=202808 RepID=UPI001FB4063F|nr:odorant receptor 13a-like [Vespa velutina]
MDIEHYVSINKKILQMVGFYPKNKVRSFFCILCMFPIIIPQIIQIYQDWNDLNIVLEISSVLLMILLGMSKTLVCTVNSSNVEILINFLLTDFWQYATNNLFYRNLEKYAIKAKNITKGYLFLIFNVLVVFFTLPLIDVFILKYKGMVGNNSNYFPFMALYPDSFYEFPLYEIVYVSQMIATSICGLLLLAIDTLIATAVIHTCGHFVTLQKSLNNINKNCNLAYQLRYQRKSSKKIIKNIKYQLMRNIKYHHIILRFCEIMEKNFSLILFLQTISSSLIICLVGIQVSNSGLTDGTKSMKYFSYLIMALSQLLLFCFPGDQLIYQSSMVSKTIYSIEWYQTSVPIKSEVCMMILRSQKPSYITAGKFYVMHLENFNAV